MGEEERDKLEGEEETKGQSVQSERGREKKIDESERRGER